MTFGTNKETIAKKFTYATYTILLTGVFLSFVIFTLEYPIHWKDVLHYPFGLILFIVCPMAVFSIFVFVLTRYYETYWTAFILLIASIIMVLLGVAYYVSGIFLFKSQESNLLFLFIPTYQLLIGFLFGVSGLIVGILTKSRHTNNIRST